MKRNNKRLFSLATLLKLFLISSISAANPFTSFKDGGNITEGDKNVKVINLTNDQFKQIVFNYDKNKEWKYEGKIPAIIDFYASWCPPCRQLSPLVEEVAKEYSGKIVVYKVDTDKEQVLSQHLGITGLPTLLFIPVKGDPETSMGFIPKETIVKTINSVLLNK
jgi:thioredoxin 1